MAGIRTLLVATCLAMNPLLEDDLSSANPPGGHHTASLDSIRMLLPEPRAPIVAEVRSAAGRGVEEAGSDLVRCRGWYSVAECREKAMSIPTSTMRRFPLRRVASKQT